jgi:predicted permease
VLAALGGGAGLFLAYWFSRALVTMMANGGTLVLSVAPDWRVLAFTGAVSLLACVFAGLGPGLHAMRANLNPALKQSRSGGRRFLGQGLVIAQLSISMVLVVGATLFIGTLLRLYRTDRGLHTEGVLTFGVRSGQRYAADRSLAVQTALLKRLDALPGVKSASAAQVLPIAGGLWTRGVKVEGYTFRPDEDEDVGFNVIAPNYFATIGTPIVLGREFDSRDSDSAKRVAVVNESFARYFFGAQAPLGRHVTSVNVTYEIVGVVKDAKYESLKAPVRKTMYIPWMQRPGEQPGSYTYLARVAGGNPLRLAPSLERLVREADPALRLRTPRSYDEVVDQSIVSARMMATLGGFFGVLALVVACLGIFGLMAFQVSRRVNEVGVRMALGARRLDIQALVLRDVVIMLIFGSAIGSAVALALSGLAGKMLFGITAAEPGVFVFSGLVLGAAALSAAWLPALRASRIDPMAALRHE